jgi:hypothetical protein
MASKATFTALDLDIFTRLSGHPKDLGDIAREAEVRPNQLLTLMTALVCLGLVVNDGHLYANAPASETYLAGRMRHFSFSTQLGTRPNEAP